MIFIVHDLGEFERSRDGLSVTRPDPIVTEYQNESDIPKWARPMFDWMLEQGEPVTTCGSIVYQIRRI